MTVKSLKHKLVSAVADSASSGVVKPSNWNADHDLYLGVNAQTGTTYTFVDTDDFCLVSFSNGSAIAATLPQANSTTFISGWIAFVRNLGAGTVTITPTTSTIDGAASLALLSGHSAIIVSDGTNYTTLPMVNLPIVVASGKTITLNNTLTFAGTDGTTMTFPAASDTVAGLGTAQTFTNQNIHDVARTIVSATGVALDDVKVAANTTTITGNTGSPITRLAKVGLYRPTITDASAVTVTDAATLYIDNAPLAAGSVTITNPWALLVGTGASKLQATTINGALTYGGVALSNAVTGTGSMVLSASQTLTGTLTAAIANFSGVVTVGLNDTSVTPAQIQAMGGSGAAGGGRVNFGHNGTVDVAIGGKSSIDGSGTSRNFVIFMPTFGNYAVDIAAATGAVTLNATTSSASTGTGALIVAGGVGVAGNLFAGGTVNAVGQLIVSSGNTQNAVEVSGSTADLGIRITNTGTSGRNFELLSTNSSSGVPGAFRIYDATAGTDRVTIDASGILTIVGGGTGQLVVNSTAAQIILQRSGSTQSRIYDDGTAVFVDSGSGTGAKLIHGQQTWVVTSDARFPYKRTARDITGKLPSLASYRLYENEFNGYLDVFPKAQEVNRLWPHVVVPGSDDPDFVPTSMNDAGVWFMKYDRLGAIALAYAREHEARLDGHEARITKLESAHVH